MYTPIPVDVSVTDISPELVAASTIMVPGKLLPVPAVKVISPVVSSYVKVAPVPGLRHAVTGAEPITEHPGAVTVNVTLVVLTVSPVNCAVKEVPSVLTKVVPDSTVTVFGVTIVTVSFCVNPAPGTINVAPPIALARTLAVPTVGHVTDRVAVPVDVHVSSAGALTLNAIDVVPTGMPVSVAVSTVPEPFAIMLPGTINIPPGDVIIRISFAKRPVPITLSVPAVADVSEKVLPDVATIGQLAVGHTATETAAASVHAVPVPGIVTVTILPDGAPVILTRMPALVSVGVPTSMAPDGEELIVMPLRLANDRFIPEIVTVPVPVVTLVNVNTPARPLGELHDTISGTSRGLQHTFSF